MPKSKRAKLVSLTAVKANRKELKKDLVETIRSCAETYDTVYVFTYENMRTAKFKEIRAEWTDSRFFLGKNRVMQKALGDTADEAHRPNLDKLACDLVGNVGLLFTNKPEAEVREFMDTFEDADYARAGFVPSSTVTVPAGRLEHMPHTMAETLQKLGMPVRLDKGVVVLPIDFAICKEGEAITPEQGRLLRHFGHQLATFKLRLVSSWKDGKYTSIAPVTHAAAAAASTAAAGGAGTAGAASAKRKLASRAAAADDDDDDDMRAGGSDSDDE